MARRSDVQRVWAGIEPDVPVDERCALGGAVDDDDGVGWLEFEQDRQHRRWRRGRVLQTPGEGEPRAGGVCVVDGGGGGAWRGRQGEPAQHNDGAFAHAAYLGHDHAVGASGDSRAQRAFVVDEAAIEAGVDSVFDEACGARLRLGLKAGSNDGGVDCCFEGFARAGQQTRRVGGEHGDSGA